MKIFDKNSDMENDIENDIDNDNIEDSDFLEDCDIIDEDPQDLQTFIDHKSIKDKEEPTTDLSKIFDDYVDTPNFYRFLAKKILDSDMLLAADIKNLGLFTYVTGEIKPREETHLRPKLHRYISKQIKKARASGIMPHFATHEFCGEIDYSMY